MRAQYHSRQTELGHCIWDVRKLVERTKDLPGKWILLSEIRELDEPYWADDGAKALSCRDVVGHTRLILDCDLQYPIILSRDGRVMDGMHRVCRALLDGLTEIAAVQLELDPEPDYIGVALDDLPYDDD